MAGVVELEVPPRSDHLSLVRLVVETTTSMDGRLSERDIDDLRLAVSEASANAVEALHGLGSDTPIRIRIDLGDDHIAVTVTDHGGGFDVAEVDPIPHATDPSRLRHESGLGIPLIRSLVDEVTFNRTIDGTAVLLLLRT